ncbi:multidrug resistance protein A [Escherichia coli]|uniref:Multidrug resistance protein A n=1 Tax=Escherichia coli TaxID=562 RepID=A0A376SC48_ECOLX|nr:multidrug resistance protein A [Escherichia coli]
MVLRHFEETDDAYVAGNQIQIMSQVSGSVTKVWADNTDFVKEGDVLVTLDPTDARQAFEKAKTALASSVRQTHQLMINSKQLQANIEVQKIALAKAQSGLQPPCAAGQCQPDWSRRVATRPRRRHQCPGATGRRDSNNTMPIRR